jgi:peptidoglycan hydrolase CwlO-like protein
MKKAIFIIVPLLVLGVCGLLFREQVMAKTKEVLYASPCETPKVYRIGTVDPQYEITEAEFTAAIEEAGEIWNTAYGRKVFQYDPKATFTVNLKYDDRQHLTQEINELNDTLKQEDEALQPEIEEYNRKSADLKSRIDQLNAEIQSWNEKGGAPADVYERLKSQQAAYQAEAKVLNDKAESLSLTTRDYNAKVHELDQTVNTFNSSLQFKPEGGKYVLDAEGERIEIHIYSTREELINILTHELGHALGMEHVNNPEAVMYSKSNGVTTLSPDDLQLLVLACQEKNVLQMKYVETAIMLQQTLRQYIQK